MSTQQQIRVGLESSTPILCDKCNNDTFVEVQYLRKISKILLAAPDDMIVNLPAFACSKCGHVNDSFKFPGKKEELKKEILSP